MMKSVMIKFLLCLFPLFLLADRPAPSVSTVTVTITGIRATSGTIRIGLYTSESTFADEIPLKRIVLPKTTLQSGHLTTTLQLPYGTYGIALMDDENGNEEMDYGFILPEEGFGFSNYYHTGLSKPSFSDFKFSVQGSATSVSVKLKYM